MQMNYTFRNLDATDSLKEHAIKKLHKLDKYLLKPLEAHVIFNVEKVDHKPHQHHVEITVIAGGVQHVSQECSDDMYASLNKAVTKLEQQLRRQKERLKDHHKKG